ncbi:MAG: Arc family DNA-binding protein [Pirellula sp.]
MAKRDSFLLRINPEVLEALRVWADDEFRSLNGQIEFALHRALEQAGRLPKAQPTDPKDNKESRQGDKK